MTRSTEVASDPLNGGAGNDTLIGNTDNDGIEGGAATTRLTAGPALTSYDIRASLAGVVVTLGADGAQTTATGGDADGDTIQNVEHVIGSNFSDALTGNELNNTIDGAAGNDVISAAVPTLIRLDGRHDSGAANDYQWWR